MNSKIVIKEVLVLTMLGAVIAVGYFYLVALTVLQNKEPKHSQELGWWNQRQLTVRNRRLGVTAPYNRL